MERIEADLKRRIDALNKAEQDWFAGVPEARKAECRAIPPTTLFSDMPNAELSESVYALLRAASELSAAPSRPRSLSITKHGSFVSSVNVVFSHIGTRARRHWPTPRLTLAVASVAGYVTAVGVPCLYFSMTVARRIS